LALVWFSRQVVMTDTDRLLCIGLIRHLKQCLICIQNVIIERKTLNASCHKHA